MTTYAESVELREVVGPYEFHIVLLALVTEYDF